MVLDSYINLQKHILLKALQAPVCPNNVVHKDLTKLCNNVSTEKDLTSLCVAVLKEKQSP